MIDSKKIYDIAKLPYDNHQSIKENEQYIAEMMDFISLPTLQQCQAIQIEPQSSKEVTMQNISNQYKHMMHDDIFLNTSKDEDPYFICRKQGDI